VQEPVSPGPTRPNTDGSGATPVAPRPIGGDYDSKPRAHAAARVQAAEAGPHQLTPKTAQFPASSSTSFSPPDLFKRGGPPAPPLACESSVIRPRAHRPAPTFRIITHRDQARDSCARVTQRYVRPARATAFARCFASPYACWRIPNPTPILGCPLSFPTVRSCHSSPAVRLTSSFRAASGGGAGAARGRAEAVREAAAVAADEEEEDDDDDDPDEPYEGRGWLAGAAGRLANVKERRRVRAGQCLVCFGFRPGDWSRSWVWGWAAAAAAAVVWSR
jgi:hypothetical protein